MVGELVKRDEIKKQKKMLREILKSMPDVPAPVSVSRHEFKRANDEFGTFWTAESLKPGREVIMRVVKIVLSMPGASSSVETAFSGAGRLDHPLRSRLTPEKLQMQIVLQQAVAQGNVTPAEVANEVQRLCSQ